MITKLINPKTNYYKKAKEFILSNNFPWFLESEIVDGYSKEDKENYAIPSFWSHGVLIRPLDSHECSYPRVNSQYMPQLEVIFNEIFEYNNLPLKWMYRLNINLVQPHQGKQLTSPHCDHPWPHKNILIYLTDAGGETICEGESHNPAEDDIIIFSGYPERHHYKLPKEKNRVVIVGTYI